jgi:protein tyrosine phosphatase (PTP) superfamily phosphohydrolase (DUF442 family)
MQNARKYDSRITIGGVPSRDDLLQMQALGYRTVVDLRDDHEKFGGLVEEWAREHRMRYVSLAIQRDAITIDDALRFYSTVYDPDAAPLYLFSRFGKRPLALLLLLQALLWQQPLVRVFQSAGEFGLDLEGDLCLRSFLVDCYNRKREYAPLLQKFASERPGLIKLPTDDD